MEATSRALQSPLVAALTPTSAASRRRRDSLVKQLLSIHTLRQGRRPRLEMRAEAPRGSNASRSGATGSKFLGKDLRQGAGAAAVDEADEEDEFEEVSWISEKLESAKEVTQGIVAAVPGPRVGSTSAPWLLVLPAAYLGITFIVAVVRTVQKFSSPRAKRKRQVNKNAGLVESIDESLDVSEDADSSAAEFGPEVFQTLRNKYGFSSLEVVRKFLRFALNEKPFTPRLVSSLILFRNSSGLSDDEVVQVLNDIAQRTVKAKGRVMMDTSGFTEKGLQRKAAVQGVFSKLLYLAELDEFCSPPARENLQIKSIFGVTDEDVDQIRIVSLSSVMDLDQLEKNLGSDEDEDGEKEAVQS